MKMYAKIINNDTGLCMVGSGNNTAQYRSMAMTPLDVQQSDIDGQWYLKSKCPMKSAEEKEQEERERIGDLNLTAADVERGIYKAKGMDFEDIIKMLGAMPASEGEEPMIDVKSLKIELKANNFYRKHPYIDLLGQLLGFTPDMLDRFFDFKDYRYLTTCKLTINPTPEDSTVFINEVEGTVFTAPYGSTVNYFVSCEGYESRGDIFEITEDTTLNIELEKSPVAEETSGEAENVG